MTTFKFPGREDEIEFETLPEASRRALLSRVVGHFNNELSAAVIAFGRDAVAKSRGNGAKASDVSTAESREYRDSHAEAVSDFAREWMAAKFTQIMDGTLGVRSGGGTSVDPLEKEMLRIASEEIKTVFNSKGWKFPRGEETFTAGKITTNREGWIDRWLNQSNDKLLGGKGEPNEPRIKKMAERNLANKAALAKRAASAEVEGDELGL